ncbi:MAG: CHASE2 domain-containing protein [Cyanobacteriota bacterium]|nr:CHASE2 domain-containing protein [Cyanobacteriota bacterium]
MTENKVFNLKIDRIDDCCLFQLFWGDGCQLSATLNYCATVTEFYQDWRDAYLDFYDNLRGKVADDGYTARPRVDRRPRLREAEAKLISEFEKWLRHGELYEIREEIENAAYSTQPNSFWVEVSLCCNDPELLRLPWEVWAIATDRAAKGKIRFSRIPSKIRGNSRLVRPICRQATVLAILGDDTGLNFEKDREALRSLSGIAAIEFVGWQPDTDISVLKKDICGAIADEKGWDILFFAGHSNETRLTGGEFNIAPGVSMSVSDIEAPLKTAIQRGLKFAIFNSCSGISIAQSLIDLGLNQVAVMREPIHNKVAQEFLVAFTQSLAAYKDVAEALLDACNCFRKPMTDFPSAHLIPSLFCRPGSEFFRIEPFGFKQWLKRWIPTGKEVAGLALLGLISWQLPVQQFLLDRRVLGQAIYRQVTGQTLSEESPPVLLVQIDNESISRAGIAEPNPMKRDYLAELIDRVSELDARVVGIDYLLDRTHGDIDGGKGDRLLANSIKKAVTRQPRGSWFVFVEYGSKVIPEIANLNWSLSGHISIWGEGRYLTLLPFDTARDDNLPFAYMLAFASGFNGENWDISLQPNLENDVDFFYYLNRETRRKHLARFSPRARLSLTTVLSYWLGQMWLHPIVDYSISYRSIYEPISAWELLTDKNDEQMADKIVIIAPGGYYKAGLIPGEDNIKNPPPAFSYWRGDRDLTGGEVHAYLLHHLLTNRMVIPIPDLWAILVAAFLGKAVGLLMWNYPGKPRWWMVGLICGNLVYVLVSFQVYISGAVLLPVVLTSGMFLVFITDFTLKQKR